MRHLVREYVTWGVIVAMAASVVLIAAALALLHRADGDSIAYRRETRLRLERLAQAVGVDPVTLESRP